jgi:hypothetical protein
MICGVNERKIVSSSEFYCCGNLLRGDIHVFRYLYRLPLNTGHAVALFYSCCITCLPPASDELMQNNATVLFHILFDTN